MTKMLILFQKSVDVDAEPEWIIGCKVGTQFEWDNDDEEPLVWNAILTQKDFNKLSVFAELCSYDTTRSPLNPKTGKGGTVFYNVKPKMFDSFIDMLGKMKEVA